MLSGHRQALGNGNPAMQICMNQHKSLLVLIAKPTLTRIAVWIAVWWHSDEGGSSHLPSVSVQIKAVNELAQIPNVLKRGKHRFHL